MVGNRFIDLTGEVFGFLTVLELAVPIERGKQALWSCRCVCGNEHVVPGSHLRQGKVKSCSCKKAEMCKAANVTHGAAGPKDKWDEYRVWVEMTQRCENPKANRYYTHGARGIKVCTRWRESFKAFIEDMGRRPEKGLSLERRNNDGDYEPANCYWATRIEQARNRRDNVRLTVGDVTRLLVEWAEVTGIGLSTLQWRIKAGMTPEEVIQPGRRRRWKARPKE